MAAPNDIEEFKQHPLWSSLDETIESWEESTPQSSVDRHTIARVVEVLRYTRAFRALPPGLYTADRVTHAGHIQAQVDALHDLWRAWTEEEPMAAPIVARVDNLCDQVLVHLNDFRWPPLQKESRARIFQESADAYREVAEKSLEGLSERIAQLQKEIADSTDTLNALTAESQARGDEAKLALAEIESTRAAQAENAQEQLQAELRKLHEAAKTQRQQHADNLDEQLELTAARSEAAVNALETDAELGQKLVQIVGDQSQAGG